MAPLSSGGSAVLLHASAHNPTGIDPTPSQWERLAHIFAERELVASFREAVEHAMTTRSPLTDEIQGRLYGLFHVAQATPAGKITEDEQRAAVEAECLS